MTTSRWLTVLALVAAMAAGGRADDRAKRRAESGPERVLRTTRPDTAERPGEHPRVAPGRVRWHADEAAARRAAAVSGKPVLVFQLLGRLDEEFC